MQECGSGSFDLLLLWDKASHSPCRRSLCGCSSRIGRSRSVSPDVAQWSSPSILFVCSTILSSLAMVECTRLSRHRQAEELSASMRDVRPFTNRDGSKCTSDYVQLSTWAPGYCEIGMGSHDYAAASIYGNMGTEDIPFSCGFALRAKPRTATPSC